MRKGMAMVLIILLLVLSGSNVIRGSRQLVVATEEKTASLYVFNNANHHQSNQLQHQNHHGNHTHHSNLINPSHHKWDCNRSWPSLELFMPMQSFPSPKHPRYYEAEVNFLRSFLHFWPLSISNTSLVLTYDKETSNSQFVKDMTLTMQALSKRLYGRWNMIGIPTFPYYREGYDRQQYNMFWADNYTTSDYIGFVDTDTIFTTYIDREDLFEDGKPVINAKGAITREAIPTRWFQSTNRTMHMLESLTCMAYFPVIIKRTHLRDIRDYIAKLHGMSFDEAFYRIITLDKNYSQFNIMCAYLWKFKREEYKWYVRMMQLLDGDTIPNPLPGQDPDLTQFSSEMRFPKPFIATHSRYRRTKTNGLLQIAGFRTSEFNYFLQQGTCYSPPFPRMEDVCQKIIPYKYYYEMHNFDYIDFTQLYPIQQLNAAAAMRYERIKNCNPIWNANELKKIMPKIPKLNN